MELDSSCFRGKDILKDVHQSARSQHARHGKVLGSIFVGGGVDRAVETFPAQAKTKLVLHHSTHLVVDRLSDFHDADEVVAA